MDNSVAVTLFRHGITKPNLEKRYLGWSDPPITENAAQELIALQDKMKGYDLCITSDLSRCRQTADILCANLERFESRTFRELNFGQWELKTYEQLCHHHQYNNWLDNPAKIRTPDGESFTELEKRVMEGWNFLKELVRQNNKKNILLITHGGVIRLLLSKLSYKKKSFWQWQVPHNKGIQLSWNSRSWREGSRCTSLQEVPSMEKENG